MCVNIHIYTRIHIWCVILRRMWWSPFIAKYIHLGYLFDFMICFIFICYLYYVILSSEILLQLQNMRNLGLCFASVLSLHHHMMAEQLQ